MSERNRRRYRLRTCLPALGALMFACTSPMAAGSHTAALAAPAARTPSGGTAVPGAVRGAAGGTPSGAVAPGGVGGAVAPGVVGGAVVSRPVGGAAGRASSGGTAAPGAVGGAAPAASSPVTGNATWFTGLGSPYGGCGLPQANLDSQDFVALNVFNTPHDYNGYPRPIAASDAARMGIFANGLNCGRYVQVTIGDYCTGVNDGAPNQPFCRNGSWTADAYDGATLTMQVADSCADGNAWCRDDPYHLDLAQGSLNRFVKNGAPVGDMYPGHWNNRHISWQFVSAPGYTGDIKIGFLQNAQVWWPVIAVSHLPNGIHGVQYYDGSAWKNATMDGDMGQAYVIAPTATAGRDYRIRVVDASDAPVGGGRVYSFSLPSSCTSSCGPAYTPVTYTTATG